jgi:hypothetical protein
MWPATAAASGSARRLGHDDKGEFRHPRHVHGARRPERAAGARVRELAPGNSGTSLLHTEHYVFLAYTADGAHDTAHLQGGTRLQLNALAAALG